MLHLFKYRFKQTIRDFSFMFWAAIFPLILATLFYFTFGNITSSSANETAWDEIKVAVIGESDTNQTFQTFLEEINGEMINIQNIYSEKQALNALNEETILGIFYIEETPALTVGKNGLNESILTALLETYNQNAAMLSKIAEEHPENLVQTIESMEDYSEMVHEESLGGNTLNSMVSYFFALIAYACLSGTFLGVRSSFDSQANLSPLGARRSITPTHKLTLVLVDMLVVFLIHFMNIILLNLYIVFVLGISLGNNIGALLLVDLMGSMIGVCLGIAFGCISKWSLDIKLGLSVTLSLFPGFLAGLMVADMKNYIENICPIINRINPAAVLSDAFYYMSVYNDMERFHRCLLILAIMCIVFLFLAFLGVRREKYNSI